MLLLTGGTGSLGRAFLTYTDYEGRIRILSRDEQKQDAMRRALPPESGVQFVLGDVRDPEKLTRAMQGIETVIHAAALKIIPNGSYNPDEFIKTNIVGTANVFHAAIAAKVKRVLFISTDKGVEPTTLYGGTKLIGEHLAVQANRWSETTISAVRYGNVEHSRGSFLTRIRELEPGEVLPVTDPDSTRFWITLEAAVKFIDFVLEEMKGGEIFVPRLPARRLGDLIPDGTEVELIGLRWTERKHETLIGEDELRRTDSHGHYFVIHPDPYRGNLVERVPWRSDGRADWGSD